MKENKITRARLREVRKMWEAAEQESIVLHASIISGRAKLIYENAPTESDPYDTDHEFCSLASRIDRIKPPPYGRLDRATIYALFSILWKLGAEDRMKLEGKWPAWACSWWNWQHLRCYGLLALFAARPLIPIPARMIEPVIRTISAA